MSLASADVGTRRAVVDVLNFLEELAIALKTQRADEEMVRTFNCGAGMILAVSKEDADHVISQLQKMGERAWKIGVVDRAAPDEKQVQL